MTEKEKRESESEGQEEREKFDRMVGSTRDRVKKVIQIFQNFLQHRRFILRKQSTDEDKAVRSTTVIKN